MNLEELLPSPASLQQAFQDGNGYGWIRLDDQFGLQQRNRTAHKIVELNKNSDNQTGRREKPTAAVGRRRRRRSKAKGSAADLIES